MRSQNPEGGFTLVELMIVVLIIGILVAMAVPAYGATRDMAKRRACFANQRTIQGAIIQYAARSDGVVTPAVGLIDGNHPFIHEDIFRRPPTCPAAPHPADPMMPTLADGAYTVRADASLEPCSFGGHGSLY